MISKPPVTQLFSQIFGIQPDKVVVILNNNHSSVVRLTPISLVRYKGVDAFDAFDAMAKFGHINFARRSNRDK